MRVALQNYQSRSQSIFGPGRIVLGRNVGDSTCATGESIATRCRRLSSANESFEGRKDGIASDRRPTLTWERGLISVEEREVRKQ